MRISDWSSYVCSSDLRLDGSPGPLGGARILQGKAMSFNNWLDAAAARALAWALPEPAVVIVKHSNPCGVATAPAQDVAYRAAQIGSASCRERVWTYVLDMVVAGSLQKKKK